MTEPLTDAYLREVRERAEKATPGPWAEGRTNNDELACLFAPNGDAVVCAIDAGAAVFMPLTVSPGDAAFIAHAREDVPRLLGEIERLKAELAPLRALAEHEFG